MSFQDKHKTVNPDKITGYKYGDHNITVAKKVGRPPKIHNPLFYPLETKVEAAASYCVLGDLQKVSDLVKVPLGELKKWKKEDWWVEVQHQIMVEQNEHFFAEVHSALNKALVQITDRLENGDPVYQETRYNYKTGDVLEEGHMVRVPIKGKELAQIFHALAIQREKLLANPELNTQAKSIEDRLQTLAEKFEAFTDMKVVAEQSQEGDSDGNDIKTD